MENTNPLKIKSEVKVKRHSKLGSFFKAVFVHNIGYKLLAIGLSIVLWVLAVGLG